MNTTLNKIRAQSPCANGWTKLLKNLGKTQADDAPLTILTILNSNGLDHAIWCLRAVDGYEKEIRLYAVWCARQVQHLIKTPCAIAALDVAERHAYGKATDEDLAAVHAAARAARDAARTAAWAAAQDAAQAAEWAAWAAAQDAAWAAAWDAARAAGKDAGKDAGNAAARAAWDAQEAKLRGVLAGIEAKPKEKNT